MRKELIKRLQEAGYSRLFSKEERDWLVKELKNMFTIKYTYNDEVFLMKKNEIIIGSVYMIKILQDTVWDMQIHNYKGEESEKHTEVYYKVTTDAYNKQSTGWIAQDKLFESKKELLASL